MKKILLIALSTLLFSFNINSFLIPKLKLATLFSGIGAIEQALLKQNIEHKR